MAPQEHPLGNERKCHAARPAQWRTDQHHHRTTRHPDGGIALEGHDVGEAPRRSFGSDDYEYTLTIPADGLQQLALALLKDRLAGDLSAVSTLRSICSEHDIPARFRSYP